MSLQPAKPWVVPVIGPEGRMEFYLVQHSAGKDAKERVTNIARNELPGWHVGEPQEPRIK